MHSSSKNQAQKYTHNAFPLIAMLCSYIIASERYSVPKRMLVFIGESSDLLNKSVNIKAYTKFTPIINNCNERIICTEVIPQCKAY